MLAPLHARGTGTGSVRHLYHWVVLSVSAAVYVALFALYYPPIQGVEDEVGFINEALVFSRGAVSARGAGFDTLGDFRPYKGRLVGIRNPGRPLLTAPFVAVAGLRSVFVPGALIHLGLTLTGAMIFVQLGMSPLWSALILWHPTLSLYSRTVMGDTGAGLLLLVALLSLLISSRPGLAAGLAIGSAAVMRYQAGLILPFFSLAILMDASRRDRLREAIRCLVAGLAIGALVVIWNLYLYGSTTGIVKGDFGLGFLPHNLLFYGTALLVLWPLMLVAPFTLRGRLGGAVAAICLPTLGFFLIYYFHDSGPSWAQTLVVGQRLIQIALPAWIVGYAAALDRHLVRRLLRTRVAPAWSVLAATFLLIMPGFNSVMFARHQEHLDSLAGARSEISSRVPTGSLVFCNSVAEKILGVPAAGVGAYRLHPFDIATIEQLAPDEADAWYIVILTRYGDAIVPEDPLHVVLARGSCLSEPVSSPGLMIYRCPGWEPPLAP